MIGSRSPNKPASAKPYISCQFLKAYTHIRGFVARWWLRRPRSVADEQQAHATQWQEEAARVDGVAAEKCSCDEKPAEVCVQDSRRCGRRQRVRQECEQRCQRLDHHHERRKLPQRAESCCRRCAQRQQQSTAGGVAPLRHTPVDPGQVRSGHSLQRVTFDCAGVHIVERASCLAD
jgi:hypothetical protein